MAKRPTLDDLDLSLGKRTRMHRLLYELQGVLQIQCRERAYIPGFGRLRSVAIYL